MKKMGSDLQIQMGRNIYCGRKEITNISIKNKNLFATNNISKLYYGQMFFKILLSKVPEDIRYGKNVEI